jgi:hypothetical protein
MTQKSRVSETVTVSGSGSITLSSVPASVGFQTFFSAFGAIGGSPNLGYSILDNVTGAWETGVGTYTASAALLTRSCIESSASGNQISFAGNPCTVSNDFVLDINGNLNVTNLPTGPSSMSSLVPISGTGLTRVLGIITAAGLNTGVLQLVSANKLYLYPISVTLPTLISNLGGGIASPIVSGGPTYSVAIYADNNNSDGQGNRPIGAPIISASNISASATGPTVQAVTPYTLLPGVIYWAAILPNLAFTMRATSLNGSTALGVNSANYGINCYTINNGSSNLPTLSSSIGQYSSLQFNNPYLVFS